MWVQRPKVGRWVVILFLVSPQPQLLISKETSVRVCASTGELQRNESLEGVSLDTVYRLIHQHKPTPAQIPSTSTSRHLAHQQVRGIQLAAGIGEVCVCRLCERDKGKLVNPGDWPTFLQLRSLLPNDYSMVAKKTQPNKQLAKVWAQHAIGLPRSIASPSPLFIRQRPTNV
ncbi:Protein of unknown function [Cotesia congregata]|uniref:Uncharacterized protein n=1 Tax=Cotesia congregata TaxID=51543 RepID=A0A8J2HF50_COTCN|nr:Protein of unknown function [Cotesia congregata]